MSVRFTDLVEEFHHEQNDQQVFLGCPGASRGVVPPVNERLILVVVFIVIELVLVQDKAEAVHGLVPMC